jgi:hypothetical protein
MTVALIQTFAAAANQSFDLILGETSVPVTLVEVTPLPRHNAPGLLRDPFSLVFRSESQLVLPQRIYSFKNATIGKMDIFIVPIGRDAQGVLYQAIFN